MSQYMLFFPGLISPMKYFNCNSIVNFGSASSHCIVTDVSVKWIKKNNTTCSRTMKYCCWLNVFFSFTHRHMGYFEKWCLKNMTLFSTKTLWREATYLSHMSFEMPTSQEALWNRFLKFGAVGKIKSGAEKCIKLYSLKAIGKKSTYEQFN